MKRKIKMGILFFPLFIGGVLLFGWVLMLLWNSVLTAVIPAVHAISFWQALGLFVLSKILFGFGRGWGNRRHSWKNRLDQRIEEKWNKMSPEEKEQFKSNWANRCGGNWGHRQKDVPATE